MVSTRGGELDVPTDSGQVGWWDGGAWIGDPFGSTVLAGHVDAPDGVGLLAALLDVQVGDVVTVGSGERERSYTITSAELVDKDALSTTTTAFDQRGPHQLVLITCWGRWRPELASYDSNWVVTAAPRDPVQE